MKTLISIITLSLGLLCFAESKTVCELHDSDTVITKESNGAAKMLPKYLWTKDFYDSYTNDAAWYYSQPQDYGHCSAMRDGDFLYRNFDWRFDHAADVIVRMFAGEGRFASVGVANCGTNLTEEIIASGVPSRYFKCLPGRTVDGINENGVCAEVNVVDGDVSSWTGRVVHCMGVVRWALDHGTNAEQTAKFLAANIYFPQRWTQNFHWMIADATDTYIVENGEAHKVTGKAIMTNFRLYSGDRNGEGKERYDILDDGGSIKDVWFTKCYSRSTNPPWLSEFGYNYEDLNAALNAWNRDGATKESHRGEHIGNKWWWQTVHTSIYDLKNLTLKIAVQEQDDWYVIQMPNVGGIKVETDPTATAKANAAIAAAGLNYAVKSNAVGEAQVRSLRFTDESSVKAVVTNTNYQSDSTVFERLLRYDIYGNPRNSWFAFGADPSTLWGDEVGLVVIGDYANVTGGDGDVVIGHYAHSSGYGKNVVIGEDADALSSYSVVIGNNNQSLFANHSVVIGYDAWANGEGDYTSEGSDVVAVGDGVQTRDSFTTAVGGGGTTADGQYSTALGWYAHATTQALAVGAQAEATDYATAVGPWSAASANGAVALGPDSHADHEFAVTIGGWYQSTESGPVIYTSHGPNTINFATTDNPDDIYFRDKTLSQIIEENAPTPEGWESLSRMLTDANTNTNADCKCISTNICNLIKDDVKDIASEEIDNEVASWARTGSPQPLTSKPQYTPNEVGAYPNASGVSLAQSVQVLGLHLQAEDARVTVTNYDSSTKDPSMYLEYKITEGAEAGTWKIVWNELTRWNKLLDDILPNNYYNKSQVDSMVNNIPWGTWDSQTGGYAPDKTISMSADRVILCKGASYQRTVTAQGSYFVWTANQPYEVSGIESNGFFRIEDAEGNVTFEIVKGDKVTAAANPDGLNTEQVMGITHLHIHYPIEADTHPELEICDDLTAHDWKLESDSSCIANVTWSGTSGNYYAEVWGKTSKPQIFVKGTYQRGSDPYVRYVAALDVQQLRIGGVIYNVGTATISGHTVLTLTPAN